MSFYYKKLEKFGNSNVLKMENIYCEKIAESKLFKNLDENDY